MREGPHQRVTEPSPFGQTLSDAIRALEQQGFRASFRTETDGNVTCLNCGRTRHADEYPMLAFERVEGVSDPADENLVAAIECPQCGERGTLILPYGAIATRRDANVLSHMHAEKEGEVGH